MRRRFTELLLGGRSSCCSPPRRRSSRAPARSAASSYNVGFVYSRTGLLAAYGAEYIQGCKVRYPVRDQGHEQGQRQDDQPHARRRQDRCGHGRLRGEGPDRPGHQDHRRRRRPRASRCRRRRSRRRTRCSSSRARRPPTRSPASTSTRSAPGARPTRTSRPPRATSKGAGKKVVVFAQDSVFGQGNYAAVKAVDRRQGPQRSPRSTCPLSATDFTPFAQQAKNANARPRSSSRGRARRPARCGRRSTSRALLNGRRRRHRSRRARDLSRSSATRDRRRSTSCRTTRTRRRRTR